MCEVSHKSPSMFLSCYPVLRMSTAARRLVEQSIKQFDRPDKFA
jgi:hypothetical protein